MTLAIEQQEELLLFLVDKLGKNEFDLPPLPQVASQVLTLTSDPNTDANKLTRLIQQDPILTAKIFQTSNSAACGAQRRIESLPQAIAWLGLNMIAGTAFTLSVQSGVFDVRGYEQEVRDLWAHALATGFYAKAIAGLSGKNSDTAFLCGLLHAIGKPFIVHTVNHYRQPSDSPIPWTAMIDLMKESYVEVGRQLAEAWEFPDAVKEAISRHKEHSIHLATSPTKGAVITCLARYFATHLLDQESITPDTIHTLSSTKALTLTEENIDTLLEMKPIIRTQVQSMLS
jgi:putative nucleotidyltransferase with HDIG domain